MAIESVPKPKQSEPYVMTVDWRPSALEVASSELDAAPPTAECMTLSTDAARTAAERLLPWCLQAWPDAGSKAVATVERLDLQVRPDACDQPVRD